MLDPLDYDNRPFLEALSRKRRNAYFAVLAERFSLHFWRPFFWCLFFFGLWMIELPRLFDDLGQISAALIFFGGIFYFVHNDILKFKLPDSSALDQRIEIKNHLIRGHISVLEDKIANPKKAITRHLWSYFEQQILETFTRLKSPHPRALLTKNDPYALRFLASILFLVGLSLSGNLWSERITNGLFAISPSVSLGKSSTFSLQITPPAYTKIGQIYLMGDEKFSEPILIPQGSKVKLSMKNNLGFLFFPVFQNGNIKIKPDYMGDGIYNLETEIHEGATLAIRQMLLPRATWKYSYIIDSPPEISYALPKEKKKISSDAETQTPEDENFTSENIAISQNEKKYENLPDGQLRFPLKTNDDYGVEKLTFHLTLDPMVTDKPLGDDFSDTRIIMSPPSTEFKIDPSYDLNWHTWAGLPVVITFEAQDHIGQKTLSEPLSLTLPEKHFDHPVAKSLVQIRKNLAWNYMNDFSEQSQNLEKLLSAPVFLKQSNVIYLAIKTASIRLLLVNEKIQKERTEAAKDVIKLLWMTAIALEDGDLALAMQDLKDAQKKLEEALSDPNTPPEEISKLMDQLQEKMNEAFAQMQNEMIKRMEKGENITQMPPDMFGQVISPDVMAKMMEKLQEAMKSGDKAEAQELLSQLQRMMDMMDSSTMSTQLPSDMQMMQNGINELQELIKKQEELMNQTQEDSEQNYEQDQTDSPSSTANARAQEQKALRFVLGKLMQDAGEQLDEIPENMGKAEQAMRSSEEALTEEDLYSSIPHQDEAIQHLKEAQEDLSKQLSSRMQMMIGMGLSGNQKYDPLGRPYTGKKDGNGNPNDSDVKIPDEAQKKRVGEILDLLRRRSGELERPDDELEYFRRLLRQF